MGIMKTQGISLFLLQEIVLDHMLRPRSRDHTRLRRHLYSMPAAGEPMLVIQF